MSIITEQIERLRTLADIAKDIADNSTDTVKTLREAADTIEQLAAKVRPKTGRWIPVGYDGYADGSPVIDEWECSNCGYEHYGDDQTLTAFCPCCGCEMTKE